MKAPGVQGGGPSGKHRTRGGHRRLLAPVTATVLFVLGLSLIGVAAATQQPPPPQAPLTAVAPDASPGDTRGGGSSEPVLNRDSVSGEARTSRESAAAPVRLRVPSIDVDTTLLHLGLDADGVLEVPEDPDLVGWFSWGTAPGDLGAAVMAGHVDSHEGPAVFFDLTGVPEGAEILIDRQDGTTAVFRVDRVAHYPKDDLPTVEIYASTGRELRLITCGGEWDGGTVGYRDNIVAYATLVDSTN
nr:class F sortase [Ornithinimicrobium sediminis]